MLHWMSSSSSWANQDGWSPYRDSKAHNQPPSHTQTPSCSPICTVGARSFLTDKRLDRALGSPSSGPPQKPRRDGGTDIPISFKTESQSQASNNPFWNGLCKVWCPWCIFLERWPNGTQQLNFPTLRTTCHKAHKKVGAEAGVDPATPAAAQAKAQEASRQGGCPTAVATCCL